MTIAEILFSGSGWLVIALTLIQIIPIKVNPWSAIAKMLGKAINSDVLKELETVKKAQENLQTRLNERADIEDKRNADAQREKILHFNVELMRNIPHTREDFIEIMTIMDAYRDYCREHPEYPNSRATHAISNIERVYDERQIKNDFYKAATEA